MRTVLRRTFFDAYKAYKQRRAVLTRDHALSVARQMVEHATYCFLITHGQDGWPSARLVQPIADAADPFTLWIGTNPALRKVREIDATPKATVAIEDTRQGANLVLYGMARPVDDPDACSTYWQDAWRMFFPDGPSSDGFVLLRFEAARMELMSFGRNVVAEPFGLRPLRLVREGDWRLNDVAET
jgi:general stress protein 26